MIEYPYHMSARILSRSQGANAVAAAAYRSGQRLGMVVGDENGTRLRDVFNAFDAPQNVVEANKGNVFDYTRRHGVMSSFIAAPKGSPAWVYNRNELWNTVEAAEKRKDAQVAREIIVSLPAIEIYDHLEATAKARRLREFYERILRLYVQENFTQRGMVADVALHEPSDKNNSRHFHAHIMLSMRGLDGDDGFGAKERDWNSPALLEQWRADWSLRVNEALKAHKIGGFIDHRSYEERGLNIGATKALGAQRAALEERGIATDIGDYNRRVVEINKNEHRYLERLWEHGHAASDADVLEAITRAGYTDNVGVRDALERKGLLVRLYARETGRDSGMWTLSSVKLRADKMKDMAKALHARKDYHIAPHVVQNITGKRRDKFVREALNYVSQPQGFKVIETDNNGYKSTFLSSCRQMYETSDYEVIAVARNNEGKAAYQEAGFNKGVLTYRDFLRRFGERYTGARATKRKVIIVDDAQGLSPLQDKEIFQMAQKLDAKLIYLGKPKHKGKRLWQGLFSYYRLLTGFKRLKSAFLKSKVPDGVQEIRDAFADAKIYKAFSLQQKRSAKYINRYQNQSAVKAALLEEWFKKMKKKQDHRFILSARAHDVEYFNLEIQKKRLEKRHLQAHQGKVFSVHYQGQNTKAIARDMFVYWGDMIQFKKAYRDVGIEAGTRARVLIHYADYSLLELDNSCVVKVDLKAHNAFDLGYAGSIASHTDKQLEQGYIHHSKANTLEDAGLLYETSQNPVKLYYDAKMADDLADLASQFLNKNNSLHSDFCEASEIDDVEKSRNLG